MGWTPQIETPFFKQDPQLVLPSICYVWDCQQLCCVLWSTKISGAKIKKRSDFFFLVGNVHTKQLDWGRVCFSLLSCPRISQTEGQVELGWMVCNNRLIYNEHPDILGGTKGKSQTEMPCPQYPSRDAQCFQNMLSPWVVLTSATRKWKHPYILDTFLKKVYKWILPRVRSCTECVLLHICNSWRRCNGGVSCWAGFRWC